MTLEKINDLANLWEKTKDPKYKDLWYKCVKEFANGKNISNTNSPIRWDSAKRKLRPGKNDGGT